MIDLAATSERRLALLLFDDLVPVGLLDIELDADGRAGFAVVTAPEKRRCGYAEAAIRLLPHVPALHGATEFFAGVEEGNDASERLLMSVGFQRVTETDEDGFRYFAWPQPGYRPAGSWTSPRD